MLEYNHTVSINIKFIPSLVKFTFRQLGFYEQ